jgi:hypothetical protein
MKKMALVSAAVLSAAASLWANGASADEAQTIAVATWFVDLVQAHNGKEFCPPTSTTFGQLAVAVATFSKAHPNLQDKITDGVAIAALAASYPCSAGHAAGSSSHGPASK